MNRVILIFKKDVAHLWPQILAFLAALALFACEDPTYRDAMGTVNRGKEFRVLSVVLSLLVPIACWLLVTSLIQEEKAVGTDAYWRTRPFTLTDLLMEKALFLITFIVVPVFVCQAIVVAMHGLSPIGHLGDLIAKQVFLAAWVLLPSVAMAAVTKNLQQALVGVLVVLLALLAGLEMVESLLWGPASVPWVIWTLAAVFAACGSAAIILAQYVRRRTSLARLIFVPTIVALLLTPALPDRTAFAIQDWSWRFRSNSSPIRVAVDPSRKVRVKDNTFGGAAEFWIPLRIENAPPGLLLSVPWLSADTSPESGWNVSWRIWGEDWLILIDSARRFKNVRDLSEVHVHLRGFVSLELLNPRQSNALNCRMTDSQSPYPTSPWFGPLESCTSGPSYGTVARIVKSYDLGELHLYDGAQLH
jgi:hypothetical protein